MLFSEIYGKYYLAVSKILSEAVCGGLTDGRLGEIVREYAFAESMLRIPGALRGGSWPLITEDFRTPIKQAPTMPLTLLEKRWLKALLSDPRIKLFSPPASGLDDVEPLYDPGVFVWFDRYTDGDPFEDEGYICRFKTVLAAFRERRKLLVEFTSSREARHEWTCIPYMLEYSPKDDRFRMITQSTKGNMMTVNLARITRCELLKPYDDKEYDPPVFEKNTVILELVDERNALERAMLHFSHLERETEMIDDNKYRITLAYDKEELSEMVIRVLSFGPKLRVIGPVEFVELVRDRLARQISLGTNKNSP